MAYRETVTGVKQFYGAEKEMVEKTKRAAVKKAIRQNVIDRLSFQKESIVEVRDYLIRVEQLGLDEAEKLLSSVSSLNK